jgi:hypothetical protein
LFLDIQDFFEKDGYSHFLEKAIPLFNRPTSNQQLILVMSVTVSLEFVIVPVFYIWIMVIRFQYDRNSKFNPAKYNILFCL